MESKRHEEESHRRPVSLDMSGAGEVRGAASRFESLILDKSGAGNLEYYGTVSELAVESSGFVNVRRRD